MPWILWKFVVIVAVVGLSHIKMFNPFCVNFLRNQTDKNNMYWWWWWWWYRYLCVYSTVEHILIEIDRHFIWWNGMEYIGLRERSNDSEKWGNNNNNSSQSFKYCVSTIHIFRSSRLSFHWFSSFFAGFVTTTLLIQKVEKMYVDDVDDDDRGVGGDGLSDNLLRGTQLCDF